MTYRKRIISILKPFVTIVFLPAVILIRMLKPMVWIRFGMIPTFRIGHFVAETEKYLCERDIHPERNETLDLFFFDGKLVSNTALLNMWCRQLHVSPVVRFLMWANDALPGSEMHTVQWPSDQGFHKYLGRVTPHLKFTADETKTGEAYLERKGISAEDPFICFFARDPVYLDVIHNYQTREQWAYHDYRNASISTHLPAAEYLCDRLGYFVFRMGSIVESPLESDNPRIIDYASNGDRTELLDIFLCSRCAFFLQSGGSGIVSVSRVFQRPIVPANQIPLQWCHNNPMVVFIPKLLWSKEKRRIMTVAEILESDLDTISKPGVLDRAGIEIIDNTADEIVAVTEEAVLRLSGQWVEHSDDVALQKRFQSLFPEAKYPLHTRSRIGAEFLRNHPELIA